MGNNAKEKASGKKHPGRKPGVNEAYARMYSIEEAMSLPIRVKKEEAGRLLGYHPETVTKKARKGQIPGAVFENGTWYFSTRILLAHIDGKVVA